LHDHWSDYLPHFTAFATLDAVLILTVIPIVLIRKRDSTTAVAWCLVVLLMPVLGGLLFWVFGYNYIHRRVARKQVHKGKFRAHHPPASREATRGGPAEADLEPDSLTRLALAVGAFPVSSGNAVTLYHDTRDARSSLLGAIAAARHHVHLEFFIFRGDATGREVLALLSDKAREGVAVRLLYDAVGTFFLPGRRVKPLVRAGGRVAAFLPVNPLRSWIQVNLRNHRKIVVIDGQVGFTGGMNVGDEYLGISRRFGYWRDNFVRLEGPAVAGLERIFVEDWDFATGEALSSPAYFPPLEARGVGSVQVVESGPDQEMNSLREVVFAAILSARRRLWLASPYFVPDAGILDALRLACLRGVDVRLLCLMRPDHFLSFYASRYYFADLLAMGAQVYQYARGMMHSKLVLVDGHWALTGSANLDNRSLHLNFEVGCILHTPALVAELQAQYEKDLADAIAVDPVSFAARPFLARLTENACRLFAPVL
jgi:cardiolipin synthase